MQEVGSLRSASASWLAPPSAAGVRSIITIIRARLHINLASQAWPLAPSTLKKNRLTSNTHQGPVPFPARQRHRTGRPSEPSAGGARQVSVMWFRSDLRMHDNAALAAADKEGSSLLAVYCFDPREYSKSGSGISSTGPYRAQFVIDAVTDLRESLRAAGSNLIVRCGKPEEVLLDIVKKTGASKVYCQGEATYEEAQVERRVASALKTENAQLKTSWSSTLFDIDALPFKLADLPSTHGQFRAQVAHLSVKEPAQAPRQLKGKPLGASVAAGEVPTLAQLGLQPVTRIPGTSHVRGGESEGLARLKSVLSGVLQQGSSMLNSSSSSLAANFSQQVSPWLAMGCLSPRRMYQEVKAQQQGNNQKVVSQAMTELLWRDFFRFTSKKYASLSLKQSSPDAVAVCA
ncbi:g11410 [Coccomyxa viridis]|uniref:G11410 protein n=1 Tax=Coccomyxa viridis TaxID=1274662 RepID=A0ABP1G818_9CHLO